ncbi:MAG: hypothetical protein JHC26_00795 [Thermofilum sp.]|jgi:hypothetical protein|uniref:hypothetical protein n=1 Tax=Thermofilum sp. TaxID=1961369 RepID=UPI002582A70C|nr:hypothetical protein [Thermofilum sp.]MCI4407602.1 hypothetical protein [Thermofilum sp.]
MGSDFAKFMFFAFALTTFLTCSVFSFIALFFIPMTPQEKMRYLSLGFTCMLSSVAMVFLIAWEIGKLREQYTSQIEE